MSSIFDLPEFEPYKDKWQTRLKELCRRKSYYDGSIYRQYQNWTTGIGPRLYKGIKTLYLPLARAVDIDAGIIPGGWALAEESPAAWGPAIKQAFGWSDWSTKGVLYIHYGAQYGLVGLKVCDLREQGKVKIMAVDPCQFMLIPTSRYDQTPKMAIYIEAEGDKEYAEVIEPDRVRTYYAGQLAPLYDADRPDYPNPLGFVPFVEVPHMETGEPLSEATYQKATPMLDEVNELASYLADIVKKHAEAQWAIIGAEASDMVKSGDNIWFIPAGGDAKPLVAQIDIAGVLAFVQEIRTQVEKSLPELSFDELKSKTRIATATVELQLKELVLKVMRCRPNYDHGLADALRMAGRAGRSMGLSDLVALDDEELGFDPERPVLPLDPETKLRLAAMEKTYEQMDLLAGQSATMEGQGGRQGSASGQNEPDDNEDSGDETAA